MHSFFFAASAAAAANSATFSGDKEQFAPAQPLQELRLLSTAAGIAVLSTFIDLFRRHRPF